MTSPAFRARVPTLAPILEGAVRGLRRMPLTVAAGAVATIAAITLSHDVGDERLFGSILWSAIVGIPLFTGLRLLAERSGWRAPASRLVELGGIVLLVGFGVAWRGWSEPVQAGRVVQLLAVCSLFLAVAPYLTGPEGRGFWAYNRALLERVLVAALYAHVLFVGAAIALVALDNLFGVDVPAGAYPRLWFTAVLFLMPWFFVADLPADRATLEREEEYPRGLRAFTRFALLPIVVLYLVILLAYFIKVLITREWPSGWIGWLVSAVAVAGIFSHLLVHPLTNRAGDRWVRTYARGFYLLLLPAIAMLWLAVWQRVAQYGVTENRYFLIVLSVWLAGIAVYQLVTRARGIRVIPLTLGLTGLLTLVGPWGAYGFSEASQVRRLARLLERQGMLAADRVTPAVGAVPSDDQREISAVLRYLAETHGLSAIAPWFGGRLAEIDTVGPGPEHWRRGDERARLITAWLGVGYVSDWRGSPTQPFTYTADLGEAALAVAPYDSLLFVRRGPTTPRAGLYARAGPGGRFVEVYRGGTPIGTLPLDSLLAALREEPQTAGRHADIPASRLRVSRDSGGVRLTLQLFSVGGQWADDSLTLREFEGVVLIGRR
jgi:Domain of unknown function (DUF4153)